MFYKVKEGRGCPLVFLHGFLGHHKDWDFIISHLPFRCIAFDLPGHGLSPFTSEFFSAFLKATETFAPFHLIGYSMGGRLAAQFAHLHPEKIKTLTLLSTHLGLKTKEERQERLKKDTLLAKRILEIPIDEFLKEWYDQPLFQPLLSKMDIRSMRRRQNREAIAEALVAFSLGKQDLLIQGAPLLVGELDTVYRRHYEGFSPIVIQNAGHAIHLENPKDVTRIIYELSM